MKTQTKVENPEFGFSMEVARQPEILPVHPELERIERMGMLHDTLTHDRFKDALTVCSFDMLETGVVNAFAIYETAAGIEISEPVSAGPNDRCRFGIDPTQCDWSEETKIDELLQNDSPKKQQLLCTIDKNLCVPVPRKDVLACIMGFPMGKLDSRGLKAQDIRRPTLDLLDFYLQQEQLHPGFIGGVLTNDGINSGLILFKKREDVERVNERMWGHLGTEDGIDRKLVLGAMGSAGLTYADIDLYCPKNRDSGKLYEERVSQAVNSLYTNSPPRIH